MVVVQESFKCGKVRLFRWNEKLSRSKVSDSQGLALFVITNSFQTVNRPPAGGEETIIVSSVSQISILFDLDDLFAEDMNFGRKLVQSCQQFLPGTVVTLGEQISSYLFTRFQFDPNTTLKPDSPKTIIVVEVDRFREVVFDEAVNPNVRISEFSSPRQLPRWASKAPKEEINEDKNKMANDIRDYLLCLKRHLGMRRDAEDVTGGFVEISPIVPRKRKEEFDRLVDTCAICLDGFVGVDEGKISTTACSHVFHRHCISEWLLKKNSCPTCRLLLPLGFDVMA